VSKMLGLPPDVVEVVAPQTVPKTPSGKIRRSECKKRWQSGDLKPSGRTIAQLKTLLSEGLRLYADRARELPKKWARTGWCFTWLGGALALPQLVSLVSPKLARSMLAPLARTYLKAVGVHLDVRGQSSHPGPCILVCNHCSTLDALVLCALWETPVTFLVAPWVSKLPTLKYLISRLGHIPVHRGDPEAAEAQKKLLHQRLVQGESLAIFPEGGVEITPGLRPFALGAFQLAATAEVPIIPVALQGTRTAQPYPNEIPFPVPVMATVGPPMTAKDCDWQSTLDLSNRARSWIAEHCGDPISHRRLRRKD